MAKDTGSLISDGLGSLGVDTENNDLLGGIASVADAALNYFSSKGNGGVTDASHKGTDGKAVADASKEGWTTPKVLLLAGAVIGGLWLLKRLTR